MDTELISIVRSKLDQSDSISTEVGLFVLAALEGEEQLRALLESSEEPKSLATTDETEKPTGAYLSSLTVEGFRGIGPSATLRLRPGPGLTLVVGRNGSGKSSFAEGLELLLTGDTRRWSDRSQIWKEGWRNLHHANPTTIHAELLVEGQHGTTSVTRTWSEDAALDDGETVVQHKGRPRGGIEQLGWAKALTTYRPFLSYNELGSMFNEGPATLYDALSLILGLEDLTHAQKLLQTARLSRAEVEKQIQQELKQRILPALEKVDDPRTHKCHAALSGRKLNLDAVELVLKKNIEGVASDTSLRLLSELAVVKGPDLVAVTSAAEHLRIVASALDRIAGTNSAVAKTTAEILEAVIALRPKGVEIECPVCAEGHLDDEWASCALARIQSLQVASKEADAVDAAVKAVNRELGNLLRPMPAVVARAPEVGIDSADAMRRWAHLIDNVPHADLAGIADHLVTAAPELDEALQTLRQLAEAERARREDLWRPISYLLASFLQKTRAAAESTRQVAPLKAAETWLKDALADIRNERFAPISDRAAVIWQHFQQQSNVSLSKVELDGSGTRRRVVLEVTVDGAGGSALGVMSQGELHALALSLFLPRATLPESPFRLVVIDDPVQAMDPARVDGLARVLEDVAKERQVIVFTHDDRLPETIRRLQIDANVLEVVRRENSVVEIRNALDPVSRYIEDAKALALTEDLPSGVAARVVPGFCRFALEAACADAIRVRRLRRGERHTDVEELLRYAAKLSQRVSLALFDDPDCGNEVLTKLNDRFGRWAGDVYADCNRGSHQGCADNRLYALVTDTQRFVRELEKLS